jgi:hypothetical protein
MIRFGAFEIVLFWLGFFVISISLGAGVVHGCEYLREHVEVKAKWNP